MEFLTKKQISRRTILRGLGVTIALPMLDAMSPAGTVFAKTVAAGKFQRSLMGRAIQSQKHCRRFRSI